MKQKRDSRGHPVIISHFVDPVSVANIAKNGFISFCPVLNLSGLISQTLSCDSVPYLISFYNKQTYQRYRITFLSRVSGC